MKNLPACRVNTFEYKKKNKLESKKTTKSTNQIETELHEEICSQDNPGPEVIKLFSCSSQLSKKFKQLIKTKIPTNEEVSCFKPLRCGIHHANKC